MSSPDQLQVAPVEIAPTPLPRVETVLGYEQHFATISRLITDQFDTTADPVKKFWENFFDRLAGNITYEQKVHNNGLVFSQRMRKL